MINNIFRYLFIIFILIIFNSCSFKNTGGFFKDGLKELELENYKKNSKLVFSVQNQFSKEISGNIIKKIDKPILIKDWKQVNFSSSNTIPHFIYEKQNELIYKSKKIGKNKFGLSTFIFEPLFLNNQIFFFDFSGNIYNFSINRKNLNWKFNFYKKRYKNLPIAKKLIISGNNLIVADNIGYIYSINIETGKLNWAKNYGIPFKSNIKIDNQNIIILNQDNKYYSIKTSDGVQNLSLETFPSFLKTKHGSNISLDTNKKNVYFITSNGELYSLNYKQNIINWISTIAQGTTSQKSDLFYSSPIIFANNKIIFSTSSSSYLIDSATGIKNWEIPFASYLRPVYTKNNILFASKDGFLINADIKTGKIIWSKDLFKNNKKLKQKKIGEIRSLLLLSDRILATTSKGYFLFMNYKNGQITDYTKASRVGFFSDPIIVDKKIYIIDNKMRVLIFN